MLSPRQADALRILAKGDTVKQAARQLGCAPVTVEEHLKRARAALFARNSTHAVAIAIREGHI